jgi:hypothetical protein
VIPGCLALFGTMVCNALVLALGFVIATSRLPWCGVDERQSGARAGISVRVVLLL